MDHESGVYPRVYGGTHHGHPAHVAGHGLSPRVRGNLVQVSGARQVVGSIPACTGEPQTGCRPARRFGVYPRVYGGTMLCTYQIGTHSGLSPRVRGNRPAPLSGSAPGRSIPACTGEPHQPSTVQHHTGVYPRVYGGTTRPLSSYRIWPGLSPRVRGNRRDLARPALGLGSIPACTGEPRAVFGSRKDRRVYPRVYGGTSTPDVSSKSCGGLSPRVRGNPIVAAIRQALIGSIPACTGEPAHRAPARRLVAVYPRVYGGTTQGPIMLSDQEGLSPRVRGNPIVAAIRQALIGSIPACTGEPAHRAPARRLVAVYPRVYGGTTQGPIMLSDQEGLSPRVRGNRIRWACGMPWKGSIPACTGEPPGDPAPDQPARVYPRVYGGTRGRNGLRPHLAWSIPACTGEPQRHSRTQGHAQVYPRVYGGTGIRTASAS